VIRFWIGIASRDHAKAAEAGGFCQFGHGKKAPVRRLSPGDGLVYYAPREGMRDGPKVQAFVAIGRILPGEVYRAQQSERFCPYRRDVSYFEAEDAEIAPLKDDLSFSARGARWSMMMRRGLFEIPAEDFAVIARAMHAEVNGAGTPVQNGRRR
jgi:hypothetical protein